MDSVFAVWHVVRFEGKRLCGLYHKEEDAIRKAGYEMELYPHKDWQRDKYTDYPCWEVEYGDEEIQIHKEEVQ